MNIAVIGLGSMGKRRLRIAQELRPEDCLFGIDSRSDRREEAGAMFRIPCYESLDYVDMRIDCIFICTSPLSHHLLIHEALLRNAHVFTELNLIADGYEENMALAKKKNLTMFLSSPFLYREEMRYICEQVEGGRWNYIYHIGQYLPDWHPWENYNESFLSHKRTNACREILSLELPWLTTAFGDVKGIHVVSDKTSDLCIDFHDNYMVQLAHQNENKGILVVDVVSPVAVRNLEVYKENRYISWSGTPESLSEWDPAGKKLNAVMMTEETEHADGYSSFIVENIYINEMRAFFDAILSGKKPVYGFEQDYRILQLIDLIGA